MTDDRQVFPAAIPRRVASLLVCSLLFLPISVSADTLFRDDRPLELTLTGPFASMIAQRERKDEREFELTLGGEAYPVRLRLRGNSRLRICKFPPLRLNLKTGRMAGTAFEGEDKLKLVTHCRHTDPGEKDLLEEYLAYRMFSHLTPGSFGSRLLRIRYEDTDTGKVYERYALALESAEALAARLDAGQANVAAIRRSDLAPRQAALVYLFAYLIGNTDWSLVRADGDSNCCHNGLLLERKDSKLLFVPYDFDLAGLVNTPYARPDPSLRISRVTQRRYRGYCVNREALANALDTLVEARGSFRAMIDELPLLSTSDRQKKKRWLERFYDEAGKRERLLDKFEDRCL